MQKHIILNLVGAVALSLLCSCGQSEQKHDEIKPVPQEQVQEEIQQEVMAIEMPEVMTDIHQEAFAEFPDDDMSDDDGGDDDILDFKA